MTKIQYVGSPESVIKAIGADIRVQSHGAFDALIKLQREEGDTPKDFIDMLEKSDYFKMLHSEGFVAGMYYAFKKYGVEEDVPTTT